MPYFPGESCDDGPRPPREWWSTFGDLHDDNYRRDALGTPYVTDMQFPSDGDEDDEDDEYEAARRACYCPWCGGVDCSRHGSNGTHTPIAERERRERLVSEWVRKFVGNGMERQWAVVAANTIPDTLPDGYERLVYDGAGRWEVIMPDVPAPDDVAPGQCTINVWGIRNVTEWAQVWWPV